MEALQKDILDSDSDDSDYAPPETDATPSTGALSITKKRIPDGGLTLEDADDDDDDAEDEDEFDEEELSDDAHDVDAQLLHARVAAAAGAAASAAAGAAALPLADGASAAAAGASAAAGGAAATDGVAEVNADGGVLLENGANVAVNALEDAVLPATSNLLPNDVVAPEGDVNAGVDVAPPVENEEATLPEDEEPPAKKQKQSEGVEVTELAPAPEVDDAESKKPPSAIDQLWAEMNTPIRPKASVASQVTLPAVQRAVPVNDTSLSSFLTAPASSSAPFKVKRLDELEREVKEKERVESDLAKMKASPVVRETGLEAVLSAVRGPKRDGVLDKTRDVWRDFKDKDEKVVEELETYKKDKNRYTDKVAFLQRADVREWEVEQEGKKGRR